MHLRFVIRFLRHRACSDGGYCGEVGHPGVDREGTENSLPRRESGDNDGRQGDRPFNAPALPFGSHAL